MWRLSLNGVQAIPTLVIQALGNVNSFNENVLLSVYTWRRTHKTKWIILLLFTFLLLFCFIQIQMITCV